LDLFGAQSLFQSMNRTVTHMGKALLADWFKQPPGRKAVILRRQEAVKEIGRKVHFRQHFYVAGAPEKGVRDDILRCRTLFALPSRLSQSVFWRAAVWTVPVLWLATLAGIYCGGLPYSAGGIMFVAAFIVANVPGARIHRLHRAAEKMEKILQTSAQLIGLVEKEPFVSEELLEAQRAFVTATGSASRTIRRLSAIIGALDQRFSLAGLLLNVFYMRDMRQAMQLERWTATHADAAAGWFDALARIDALCSLGGFAFNHPDYAYPDIADTFFQMEGKALGHPLLHRDRCVKNDVSITRNPFFLIVTGANMAGKSTYLRTVGVNFLLACMGLPVCADSLTVYPARLVTSLRTADSLTAHESYFFAELKRLKMIIDRLHAGEELFIILDEILKGTNSKDKQKGSLALLKQLIALRSCGIIATHDLMLGSLEDEFPDHTRNCCFEADIAGDSLTFDYRLRPGIAQNMNASFLMEKMGIAF
jgi:DNA mismatch repair ATPase MutS